LLEYLRATLPVRQPRFASVALAAARLLPTTFGTVHGGRPFAIAKVCATAGAGLKVASPACDAVIVQEPTPVISTVGPLSAQVPLATRETRRLEDAVASTVKSASPNALPARAPNVMS